MKKAALIFLMIIATVSASAQTEAEQSLGNWLMYFGNNKLSEKWNLHTEAQYRLYGGIENFNQLLLRTGLTFVISPSADVTFGYANITSESFYKGEEAINKNEHRIWQQLILKNNVGRVMFNHRYRIEQRWETSEQAGDRYLNRLRYRLHVTFPLNPEGLIPGSTYISFYDEIFIHVNDTPFDQNRLYGGFGYRVNEELTIETGFLRNRLGNFNFNRLQFAVFFNPDFSSSK